MCVYVKAFSIRYDVRWYDLKQMNFLNKREIQCWISQKLNFILVGPNYSHLIFP
jgi:hypothetical protein